MLGRGFFWTIAIAVPMVALALMVAYLRLSNGPVSLHFLVAPIERVLNDEIPGLGVRVANAVLALSPSGSIELRVTDVTLGAAGGGMTTRAEHATFELSLPALLRGRIAPSRIDLVRPRVEIVARERATQLEFGRALQGRTLSMPAEGAGEVTVAVASESTVPKTVTMIRRRFEIARALAEAARQLRKRRGSVSHLTTLALRDAQLTIDADGQTSIFELPELSLALDRADPVALIKGTAKLAGGAQPFGLTFEVGDAAGAGLLDVRIAIDGMVPSSLAAQRPAMGLVEGLDVPLSGTGTFTITRHGELLTADLETTLGAGSVRLPWLANVPLHLSGGRIRARYVEDRQAVVISEAEIRWGGSRARLAGSVAPIAGSDGASGWRIELAGSEGEIADESGAARAIPIERVALLATVFPDTRHADVSELTVRIEGAEVVMRGSIAADGSTRTTRLDGELKPMAIDVLRRLWPRGLAPQTRAWVATGEIGGRIAKGNFSVVSEGASVPGEARGGPRQRQVAAQFEIEGLRIPHLKAAPPLSAKRALLEINGTDARLTLPTAELGAPTSRLQLRQLAIAFTGIDSKQPRGHIETRIVGQLAGLLDILRRASLPLPGLRDVDITALDGKLDATLIAEIPIGPEINLTDLRLLEGTRARIVEGHARNLLDRHNISGATLNMDVRGEAIEASGEMLVAGVLAKVSWRHVIGAGGSPVVKLKAKVGNAERAQLGIDLGTLISGEVGLEVALGIDQRDVPQVKVVADLSKAEIRLADVAWSKPEGERAEVRFDVGRRHDGHVVLQGFKLDGDRIAIGGWVALDPTLKPSEYLFPQFSLGTISNLRLEGTRRNDGVWVVKARGPFFDARDIFRDMLALGGPGKVPSGRKPDGIELLASIDTLLGANGARLRAVSLALGKRDDELMHLKLSATHDNGRSLTATIQGAPGGPRILVAEASDAGEALKLIGLYPRMVGGRGQLRLDLERRGAVERRGEFIVRSFKVIGDEVINELLYTPDAGQPAIGQGGVRGRRVVREQIDFDYLRAPFATGNGQLVLDKVYVSGPLFGATIRGKVDFRQRQLQLGGTYIPLSELNNALSSLPILGALLTGPRQEGVLGMTFAIQGPMANPQVIPNLFSIAAPGILREIFQMTPENPTVTPERVRPRRAPSVPSRTTSSPPTSEQSPQSGSTSRSSSKGPQVLDGWSTEAAPVRKPAP